MLLKTSPEISILLPFYNPGELLKDAVESILKQTFTNWELILVNNNSTDESVVIAEKYSEKDHRIKLYNEGRQGISFALNKALEKSTGKYIARMDADDISLSERLNIQYLFLEKEKNIDVVSCRTNFLSSMKKSTGYHAFVSWQNTIQTPYDHFLNRFIESPVAHPTVMFRKELIEQFGNYSKDNLPEDYELWLRWMHYGVKFYKLPENLFIWNDHPDRLSRCHNNYSIEKFDMVRMDYLSKWIRENSLINKKIIICGTGKHPKRRVQMLQSYGIRISAFTDVKKRDTGDILFLPPEELCPEKDIFIISFISQRGTREKIRQFLSEKNFKEGEDFIIAG